MRLGTLGPPHDSGLQMGPTRSDMELREARRRGWPELKLADLTFRRYGFVEHSSGDLYALHRGQLIDTVYTSAAAFFFTEAGELRFLERPPSSMPQTVAEFEQRGKRLP